jgi:hypothetical protein
MYRSYISLLEMETAKLLIEKEASDFVSHNETLSHKAVGKGKRKIASVNTVGSTNGNSTSFGCS